MELQGRLNGCPVSAGNTAVQFFENYRQPGRCRLDGSAYVSRHWLDIQMGGNQAVGYGTVAKKRWNQTFQLESI
jgi:hypothetical protein